MRHKHIQLDYQHLYTYTSVSVFVFFLFCIDYIPFDVYRRFFWAAVHYGYYKSIPLKIIIVGIIFLFCRHSFNSRFLEIARSTVHKVHSYLKLLISPRWFMVLVFFLALFFFWSFSSSNLYRGADSVMISKWILKASQRGGVFIAFDEILASLLNYVSYLFFSKVFGWKVTTSVGFVSCLLGGLFILLLIALVKHLHNDPVYQVGAVCFFLFSGFMQVYFGDIENYSLPFLLIVFYIYTTFRFLSSSDFSITIPTIIWIISLFAHVLSFTFAPSIVYIWWIKNRKQTNTILLVMLMVGILLGLMVFLFNQVTRGAHISNMLDFYTVIRKVARFIDYPFTVIAHRLITALNETILVALPGLLIFGYFIIFHYENIDFKDHIIQISFVNFLSCIFCLVLLGPQLPDWNLFAFIAIGNIVLAIVLFLRIPLEKEAYYHLSIYLIISFFHAAVLILSSHQRLDIVAGI